MYVCMRAGFVVRLCVCVCFCVSVSVYLLVFVCASVYA